MSWELKQLGEICDIQNGFAFKSKDYSESGARVIRIGNVQKGFIGDKSPRFLELKRLSEFSRFQIQEDDILISLTGDVGRVGQFPVHLLPALLNQRVGRFENIDSSVINVGFLFHVLNSDWFEKLVIESSEGAAQMNSSTKKIKAIYIPIPPIEEQERIVEVLDEAFASIDKAKANIERNLTNARELFQSRLNDIFSNPTEDWEKKPLGEMTKTGAGGTPLKSNSTFYEPPEVPWLLSGEVGKREIHRVKNQISTLGLENSSAKLFPINSVLVAMYGATAGEVGVLKVETATNQAVCAIYPCEKIGHDFIYFFMLFFKDALVAQAVGGAQPNVSQAKIKAIRIPVPSLTEQDRIVNELNALSKMRENLEIKYQSELDNLEELRQSILEQAFEGKLTKTVAA